jgi:FixH
VKVLIALVAVAALGAVTGAIWLGVRMKEPTVVADPYEAGLHYDDAHHQHDAAAVGSHAPPACDLAAGPCARAAAGAVVTLEIAPRPLRAMRDLELTVDARRGAVPVPDGVVEVALEMPGMYMGENRVRLAPIGGGRYRGRGVLVRCPSGRRTWSAEVTVAPREPATAAPIRASFTFDVAE